VRFLVDARLPVRLARLLDEAGHSALHTAQLPAGNRTNDAQNAALLAMFRVNLEAIAEAFDDSDFVDIESGSLVVHRRRGEGRSC
jgi:predicted nuclease of predicted toxin-antitoxin system